MPNNTTSQYQSIFGRGKNTRHNMTSTQAPETSLQRACMQAQARDEAERHLIEKTVCHPPELKLVYKSCSNVTHYSFFPRGRFENKLRRSGTNLFFFRSGRRTPEKTKKNANGRKDGDDELRNSFFLFSSFSSFLKF